MLSCCLLLLGAVLGTDDAAPAHLLLLGGGGGGEGARRRLAPGTCPEGEYDTGEGELKTSGTAPPCDNDNDNYDKVCCGKPRTSCDHCSCGRKQCCEQSCAPCPAGTHASAAGARSACTPCGADDKFSAAGASNCSTCPAGSSTAGGTSNTRTSCSECPAGFHSCDGSSVRTACGADNKFSTIGASSCGTCDPARCTVPVLSASMRNVYFDTGTATTHKVTNCFDGDITNMCHSGDTNKPYLTMDLGSAQDISSVKIWNRAAPASAECCQQRLGYHSLQLSSDGSTWTTCGTFTAASIAGPFDEACVGFARYVKIQLEHVDYLNLAEVKVYAPPPTPCGADGKFSAAGASNCSTCPTGSSTSGGTSNTRTSCSACPAGFHSCDGSSVRTACGADDEFSTSGASSCSVCPPGSSTAGGTSNTRTSCSVCDLTKPGYGCDGSSVPAPCRAGTFSTAGMASCEGAPCVTAGWGGPTGSITRAAATCLPCARGRTRATLKYTVVHQEVSKGGTVHHANRKNYLHSGDTNFLWIISDLGAVKAITSVQIYNRKGCCQDRLGKHQIAVSDDRKVWRVCGVYTADSSIYFDEACQDTGRYVRVMLLSKNWILTEVTVSGTEGGDCSEVSAWGRLKSTIGAVLGALCGAATIFLLAIHPVFRARAVRRIAIMFFLAAVVLGAGTLIGWWGRAPSTRKPDADCTANLDRLPNNERWPKGDVSDCDPAPPYPLVIVTLFLLSFVTTLLLWCNRRPAGVRPTVGDEVLIVSGEGAGSVATITYISVNRAHAGGYNILKGESCSTKHYKDTQFTLQWTALTAAAAAAAAAPRTRKREKIWLRRLGVTMFFSIADFLADGAYLAISPFASLELEALALVCFIAPTLVAMLTSGVIAAHVRRGCGFARAGPGRLHERCSSAASRAWAFYRAKETGIFMADYTFIDLILALIKAVVLGVALPAALLLFVSATTAYFALSFVAMPFCYLLFLFVFTNIKLSSIPSVHAFFYELGDLEHPHAQSPYLLNLSLITGIVFESIPMLVIVNVNNKQIGWLASPGLFWFQQSTTTFNILSVTFNIVRWIVIAGSIRKVRRRLAHPFPMSRNFCSPTRCRNALP
jgi:hypothetical protein